MNKGTIIRKKQIKYINENDYKRIFIISDLHGYYNLFLKFLEKVDLQKDDLLINLGDSCDRGSQSYVLYLKYYEMIKDGYNILHILGNHEDMILTAIDTLDENNIEHWYRNDGETTIESFCNVTGLSSKDFFDKEKNKFLILNIDKNKFLDKEICIDSIDILVSELGENISKLLDYKNKIILIASSSTDLSLLIAKGLLEKGLKVKQIIFNN